MGETADCADKTIELFLDSFGQGRTLSRRNLAFITGITEPGERLVILLDPGKVLLALQNSRIQALVAV